ncbi:glycosyltransferase family 4 protein [Egicoccus halophilus]|uniref:Glycosyl transferase n=1 Tax=Egicoccus halophilus TaxID=1670830 RepID=A0A8J3AEW0_9ACTN|nr:glycosyltransferase family 4 protein [Egicoccus halophilus]GGI06065.1 glycosyl transferase [Egicoccus halophilus]
MRILLVNDGASPVGGAELQMLRLRELLREAGHEVRLFASSASDLGGASQADTTTFGTTRPKLRVLNQTANPVAAAALRRELDRFAPDVVHLRMFLTQLSPLILPVLRDTPTLWQIVYYKAICPRGTKLLPDGSRCTVPAGTVCLRNRCVTPQSWALDLSQQRLWRALAGAVDVAVTLSETMRRRLAENGVRGVGVLGNGVRERAPRPPLTSPPTVVFAGRLVPEKGADLLVRAVAEVRGVVGGVRLVIAGDGPQRAELEALVDELDLRDVVQLLGHRPRAEVEDAFDPAWVQVIPGRWEEPLGNVALEAMMRGTAAVVSGHGGPAEVVEDGRTGRHVVPGSVGSLTSALAELLVDRDRCEALGTAARATALARHAEPVVLRRLLALYDEARTRATT